MILELVHMIKQRQAEIRLSLAEGHASDFQAYQRCVGEYQGLQWTLDTLNAKLAENE